MIVPIFNPTGQECWFHMHNYSPSRMYSSFVQRLQIPLQESQQNGLWSGPPSTDFHGLGEFFVDADGVLYFCVQNGTPGTWKKVQLIQLSFFYKSCNSLLFFMFNFGSSRCTLQSGMVEQIQRFSVRSRFSRLLLFILYLMASFTKLDFVQFHCYLIISIVIVTV